MDSFFAHRNDARACLFDYHEKTKQSYASVRRAEHILDWGNQPSPFRQYEGSPFFSLPKEPLPLVLTFPALSSLGEELTKRQPSEITSQQIGQILYSSMAISAWKRIRTTGELHSLRVNPSSGNLHPTETYVALQKIGGLEDGLYHYFVPKHGLEQRRQGRVMEALASEIGAEWLATAPFAFLVTSVFCRESWKYRDRGYRYCLLDAGHAAASILAAACALGLKGVCLGHLPDLALAELIGMNVLEEAPLMIIAFEPDMSPEKLILKPEKKPPPPLLGPLQGSPNRLSENGMKYPLIDELHTSTILSPGLAFPASVKLPFEEEREGIPLPMRPPNDLPLGVAARKRGTL